MSNPAIDLTGKKFGKLVVEERDYTANSSTGCARWKCRCECGKEKIVSSSDLKCGNVKSCGCLKFDNLIGQKFSRLEVIELDEKMSKRMKTSMWKCLCDCGTETIVAASSLKLGLTRSCGCYRKGHAGRKKSNTNY